MVRREPGDNVEMRLVLRGELSRAVLGEGVLPESVPGRPLQTALDQPEIGREHVACWCSGFGLAAVFHLRRFGVGMDGISSQRAGGARIAGPMGTRDSSLAGVCRAFGRVFFAFRAPV